MVRAVSDGGGIEDRLLERMTWPEVESALDAGLPLLLPVGSIEQHGPHMPLGTDAFIPHALAKRVAAARSVIVAPPLMYAGYSRPRSGGGRSFPGSTGIPGPVLAQVLEHVTADFFRQGFRKVAVLNGHFENTSPIMDGLEAAIAAREETHKALLVQWWDQVLDDDLERIFGDAFPGWEAEHASLTETSLMEELMPELVRQEHKVEGGAKRVVRYEVFPPPPDIIWPTGIGYRADLASGALGAELAGLITRRITEIIDSEFGSET